jgi:hypothetical protein
MQRLYPDNHHGFTVYWVLLTTIYACSRLFLLTTIYACSRLLSLPKVCVYMIRIWGPLCGCCLLVLVVHCHLVWWLYSVVLLLTVVSTAFYFNEKRVNMEFVVLFTLLYEVVNTRAQAIIVAPSIRCARSRCKSKVFTCKHHLLRGWNHTGGRCWQNYSDCFCYPLARFEQDEVQPFAGTVDGLLPRDATSSLRLDRCLAI